jgi:hypothetical protein
VVSRPERLAELVVVDKISFLQPVEFSRSMMPIKPEEKEACISE